MCIVLGSCSASETKDNEKKVKQIIYRKHTIRYDTIVYINYYDVFGIDHVVSASFFHKGMQLTLDIYSITQRYR